MNVRPSRLALVMTRTSLLLVVLLGAPARADTAGREFGEASAAKVFTAALAFMEPRALEATPLSTLSLWGLRGLSALDPSLTPEQTKDALRLVYQGRALITAPRPAEDDAAGWGGVSARLCAAAWNASAAIRRAGTEGVISSYFGEVFNHFDPYSRYRTPAEAAVDRADRDGTIGTGLAIGRHGGAVIVRGIAPGSPAEDAGLKLGDQIIAIDGQMTRGRSVQQIEAQTTGKAGTAFAVTVRHPDGTAENVSVVSGVVPPDTVFSSRKAGLLVLRVTAFAHGTGDRIATALTQAMAARTRPRGVVLDLRGNRGGLLDEAVSAASALLEDGALVATTAGRDPAADRVWQAEGGDLTSGLPIVVMVDGRSASAAEILAAALADDRRAVVVGSETLGKGLVQTITGLPGGGMLYLTWSRVLAPLGWPIQELGVMPQVCTSKGEEALQATLRALSDGIEPMAKALARSRAARVPLQLAQTLDIRSACPAAEGQPGDFAAAQYLVDRPDAYLTALLPAMLNLGAAP